jgi:hypothetical protein
LLQSVAVVEGHQEQVYIVVITQHISMLVVNLVLVVV